MTTTTALFLGTNCRKMKPTKQHRPAVWEAILGTVYAQNDEGKVRYFDYDWEAALRFAGVSEDRDPRVYRACIDTYGTVRPSRVEARKRATFSYRTVLWIRREAR